MCVTVGTTKQYLIYKELLYNQVEPYTQGLVAKYIEISNPFSSSNALCMAAAVD